MIRRSERMSEPGRTAGDRPEPARHAPSRSRRVLAYTTALVVLAAVCTLAVTDLRGRSEVTRVDSEIAQRAEHLSRARSELAATTSRADEVGTQVRYVSALVLAAQASFNKTESSISQTEQGISVDGVDISELGECLGGVVQALDQAVVGQVHGALSSLEAVSNSCSAARPSDGPGGG